MANKVPLNKVIPQPQDIVHLSKNILNPKYRQAGYATFDFNGEDNTTNLINKANPAPNMAKQFQVKDNVETEGKKKPRYYIPAIGELGLGMQYIQIVNNTIKRYKGDEVKLDDKKVYFASSSFSSPYDFYRDQYEQCTSINSVWVYQPYLGKILKGNIRSRLSTLKFYKYIPSEIVTLDDEENIVDTNNKISSIRFNVNTLVQLKIPYDDTKPLPDREIRLSISPSDAVVDSIKWYTDPTKVLPSETEGNITITPIEYLNDDNKKPIKVKISPRNRSTIGHVYVYCVINENDLDGYEYSSQNKQGEYFHVEIIKEAEPASEEDFTFDRSGLFLYSRSVDYVLYQNSTKTLKEIFRDDPETGFFIPIDLSSNPVFTVYPKSSNKTINNDHTLTTYNNDLTKEVDFDIFFALPLDTKLGNTNESVTSNNFALTVKIGNNEDYIKTAYLVATNPNFLLYKFSCSGIKQEMNGQDITFTITANAYPLGIYKTFKLQIWDYLFFLSDDIDTYFNISNVENTRDTTQRLYMAHTGEILPEEAKYQLCPTEDYYATKYNKNSSPRCESFVDWETQTITLQDNGTSQYYILCGISPSYNTFTDGTTSMIVKKSNFSLNNGIYKISESFIEESGTQQGGDSEYSGPQYFMTTKPYILRLRPFSTGNNQYTTNYYITRTFFSMNNNGIYGMNEMPYIQINNDINDQTNTHWKYEYSGHQIYDNIFKNIQFGGIRQSSWTMHQNENINNLFHYVFIHNTTDVTKTIKLSDPTGTMIYAGKEVEKSLQPGEIIYFALNRYINYRYRSNPYSTIAPYKVALMSIQVTNTSTTELYTVDGVDQEGNLSTVLSIINSNNIYTSGDFKDVMLPEGSINWDYSSLTSSTGTQSYIYSIPLNLEFPSFSMVEVTNKSTSSTKYKTIRVRLMGTGNSFYGRILNPECQIVINTSSGDDVLGNNNVIDVDTGIYESNGTLMDNPTSPNEGPNSYDPNYTGYYQKEVSNIPYKKDDDTATISLRNLRFDLQYYNAYYVPEQVNGHSIAHFSLTNMDFSVNCHFDDLNCLFIIIINSQIRNYNPNSDGNVVTSGNVSGISTAWSY